jgi:uncharacterized protein
MPRTIRQETEGDRELPGGREIRLRFREEGGPAVPAILHLPVEGLPVPGVLLLHGYSSRKEVLAEALGRALLERGLASLSIDLPLHGTRADPLAAQAMRNPLRALGEWRTALVEARLSFHYLAARREVDGARLGVVGYSLGSYIALSAAADDPRVRAVVVAAGGDLPDAGALTTLARTVADPIHAVKRLSGRPLLMVHGKQDRTVMPAQAARLFAAAGEPKEIRWLEAGHRLPPAAIDGVGLWLRRQLAGDG